MRENTDTALAFALASGKTYRWILIGAGLLLALLGMWTATRGEAHMVHWMYSGLGMALLITALLLHLLQPGRISQSRFSHTDIAASHARLSPTPLLEIDASGQVLYANLAAERTLFALTAPEKAQQLIQMALGHLARFPLLSDQEFELMHVDSIYGVKAHYLSDRDSWLLFVSDETAHKDFEDVLKDRDEIFRKLVEGTNEALIMTDADNNIKLVNNQFLNLFGFQESEVLHQNAVSLLMRDSDPDAVDRRHKDRLQGISDVYELEQKRKNGEPLWTLVSASPYRDRNGNVVGTIAALTDITELKKVERMLKERNEQMDLFLYKATHDLKGPLASIQGILQIAIEQCEQPTVKQYIDMAVTSAGRLDNALVDLIQVTRINKSELQIEPIVIKEVLDEVMASIQHMPDGEGVKLIQDIRMQKAFRTDRASLASILQNLVVNAAKYKRLEESHPEVKIRIYPHLKGIRIEVSDNGEGIAPDMQEKIFMMFYRGNKKSKGTGLGLYIVQKIVEKLNGEITLKSEVGKGSRFTVYLPESPALEPEPEPEPEAVAQSEKVSA
jgi:PAS domain S-box-containing protein